MAILKHKNRLRPLLFTAGGALLGFGYYYFIGCASGSCGITSHPVTAALYLGLIGWLVSGAFGGECAGKCNM